MHGCGRQRKEGQEPRQTGKHELAINPDAWIDPVQPGQQQKSEKWQTLRYQNPRPTEANQRHESALK